MKAGKDCLIFDSGKQVYAHNAIIGIEPNLYISEGYDGGIGEPDDFTKEERTEMADYAIALWTKFKEWKPDVE